MTRSEREGAALYVHGLVIDRALAGQGVGARLLRWVEQRARCAGRPWVRLDCVAGNEQLCGYYVRHGFEAVGSRSFDNGWSPVTLLEKRVPLP
ncbi:GNAT family N-acetyltransferase [Kineococcus arenarius]|uniref:GNAT family N-acetyltransferase n=1 Tax=unclassified Kineococcus TaxID=2621656 RepID=UPI003D7E3C8E